VLALGDIPDCDGHECHNHRCNRPTHLASWRPTVDAATD
jgi:hypothetical protein